MAQANSWTSRTVAVAAGAWVGLIIASYYGANIVWSIHWAALCTIIAVLTYLFKGGDNESKH